MILTVGISGSGKSTWTKEFLEDNPEYSEVNWDDIRVELFCEGDKSRYNEYKYTKAREKSVLNLSVDMVRELVSSGRKVVISNTNLNENTRDMWRSLADELGEEYSEKAFDVPLHICKKNNFKRPTPIPPEALIRQNDSMRKYLGKPSYESDTTKPDAIICDLDGTLAHNTNRAIFDYTRVYTDDIDPVVAGIVKAEADKGTSIIIFTGREDIGKCREDTLIWLSYHNIPVHEFDMRSLDDHRPDVIVKEELLWKVASRYNIKYALDDRDQIVDLWRSLGIKTLQCAYGAH